MPASAPPSPAVLALAFALPGWPEARKQALWEAVQRGGPVDLPPALAGDLARVEAELPVRREEALRLGGRLLLPGDEGADALLIATEWVDYRKADLEAVGKALKARCIFDARNIFRPEVMEEDGWAYHSLGRRAV